MNLSFFFSVFVLIGASSFKGWCLKASFLVEGHGRIDESSKYNDVVEGVCHRHRREDETESVCERHGYNSKCFFRCSLQSQTRCEKFALSCDGEARYLIDSRQRKAVKIGLGVCVVEKRYNLKTIEKED